MNKLKLCGIFFAGLLIGGLTAGWYLKSAYDQMFGSKEVELAFRVSQEANWLAGLRLNESQRVIASIESDMDGMLLAFPQWDAVVPLDEKTRKKRDGNLIGAKLYHESFPPTNDYAIEVKAILATRPGRKPGSTCSNWVCQLEDLRLHNLSTSTNSPVK